MAQGVQQTGPAPAAADQLVQGAGTLARAATLVADAEADLEAIRRRLDAQVAGLAGRWTGAGGSAFFALHRAWTDRQRAIVQALHQLDAALVATARDTTAVDQLQAGGYARVAGRLG